MLAAPDRRRRLIARGPRLVTLSLAGLWAIDALLQLQPSNFTGQLVYGTILGNAENQPQPIYGSLVTASHLLGPYYLELNLAIIVIQLAIAAGLIWPRTTRAALAVSIPWALGVWWLGEGFGGVFAGKATLLVGAPGAALLYAILALVAWPRLQPVGRSAAAGGCLGEAGTKAIWALLWTGGASLRVVPFWFAPVYALTGDLQLGLDEEPHWLLELNMRLSRAASSAGLPLVIAMAACEAAIGLGVLTRYRRAALTAGIVVSMLYWAIGQQFAGLFTGTATDLAAGPLFVLLALALWPLVPERALQAVAVPQSAQPKLRGRSRLRISLAGTPPTTASSGTSVVTTALVPTTALSPTVTPRRMQAP